MRGRPHAAPILVSNHRSFIEVIFYYWYHGPCFVAKGEVSKWPVVGTVARAFQTIFVFRAESGSKNDTLDAIANRARDDKNHWPPLLIFPGKLS